MTNDNALDPGDVAYLDGAIERMTNAGHVAAAASLAELLDTARAMLAIQERPIPGWDAAVWFAERAEPGITTPVVGDIVRLTPAPRVTGMRGIDLAVKHGKPITGLWMFDDETNRPYVVRDVDGDNEWNVGADRVHVEVLRFGTSPSAARVADAATTLRTAWQWMGLGAASPDLDEQDDDEARLDGCTGCADISFAAETGFGCDHSPGCTCRPCVGRAYERPRWCACGDESRFRAVAWRPVPQYAAEVGLETPEIDGEVFELSAPQEYAAATVCSAVCGRLWTRTMGDKLAEQLPEREASTILYRMEPWTYVPGPHNLPRNLADARSFARTAANQLDDVARLWFDNRPGPADGQLSYARGAVAGVVDAVVALGTSTDNLLWPACPFDLIENGPGERAELAPELAARVRFDPARYQVGQSVVFDRAEQRFICPTCPDTRIFQLNDRWRALLKPIGTPETGQVMALGFSKSCPTCRARLLP